MTLLKIFAIFALQTLMWFLVFHYVRPKKKFTIDECIHMCEPFRVLSFKPDVGVESCTCGPNWGDK